MVAPLWFQQLRKKKEDRERRRKDTVINNIRCYRRVKQHEGCHQKKKRLLRAEKRLPSLSKVVLIVKTSAIFTKIIQKEKKSEDFLQLNTLNSALQISLLWRPLIYITKYAAIAKSVA